MTAALTVMLSQAISLAPPLQTRVIALVVVEVFLITTAVLLYVRWVQLRDEPLDEWWRRRKATGFSPRTRALMEESERERRAETGSEEPQPATPEDRPPT